MHARDATEPYISYALLDDSGATIAQRHADERFYPASTIKLGVMLAVARAVDAGELSIDDEVEQPAHFVSGIREAPPFALAPDDREEGYAPGSPATIAHLVARMIELSSNEATNILVGLVGLDAVNAAFELCSARSTRMQRLIGDLAAAAAGRTNWTTAADLARVMRSIVTGESTGAATTSMMRRALMRQRHPRIATALPAGATWGSKSGDVPGIGHDVAFVGDPDGGDVRYLAVCTAGYSEQQANEVIAALASALPVRPAVSAPRNDHRKDGYL